LYAAWGVGCGAAGCWGGLPAERRRSFGMRIKKKTGPLGAGPPETSVFWWRHPRQGIGTSLSIRIRGLVPGRPTLERSTTMT
jgi:hypothetical protein